ncbi:hypothetical protein RI367_006289 [Sorochytrium milnesiophthora]
MANASQQPLPIIHAPEGLYRLRLNIDADDARTLAEKEVPLRVSLLEIRSAPEVPPLPAAAALASTAPATAAATPATAALSTSVSTTGAAQDSILSTSSSTNGGASDINNDAPAAAAASAAALTSTSVAPIPIPAGVAQSHPAPVAASLPDAATSVTVSLAPATSASLLSLFSTSRKAKSKSIVAKSNSNFVAKLVTVENLHDVIRSGRVGDGKEVVHIVGADVGSPASVAFGARPAASGTPSSAPMTSSHSTGSIANGFVSALSGSMASLPGGTGSFSASTSTTSVAAANAAAPSTAATTPSSSAPATPATSRKTSMSALLTRQRKGSNTMPTKTAPVPVSTPASYHWLFFNMNRTFVWMNQHATDGTTGPLSRIQFIKAYPTCHAVNQLTRSIDHVDICIGFSTGDIMWYDPINQRYNRINKQGIINFNAVTDICWLPGSETLFLASFADGTVLLLDKDREDRELEQPAAQQSSSKKDKDRSAVDVGSTTSSNGVLSSFSATGSSDNGEATAGAGASKESTVGFYVTKPAKSHKYNPVSVWQLGERRVEGAATGGGLAFGASAAAVPLSGKAVTAFAFSPDLVHVALVSADGHLRVVDYNEERAVDTYKSYFGGLTCVCWSPDGKYILTGGQDDLVSVWSFRERKIVARCRGHSSWVTAVAFDKFRCDDRNYRFGSVGQDGRLIFWDLNVKGVYRARTSTVLRRSSIVSSFSAYFGNPHGQAPPLKERHRHIQHPVLGANEVPMLEPIMTETISAYPLWSLVFTPEGFFVTCSSGKILMWHRPSESRNERDTSSSDLADSTDNSGIDLSLAGSANLAGDAASDASSQTQHLRMHFGTTVQRPAPAAASFTATARTDAALYGSGMGFPTMK